MNKRGTEKLELYIIRIVLFLIIAFTLMTISFKASQDDLYIQRFTSIETSFIRDNTYASPVDIKVTYNSIKPFTFSFTNSPCIVSVSTTEDISSASSYPCIEDKSLSLEDSTLKLKSSINLGKTKNEKSIV